MHAMVHNLCATKFLESELIGIPASLTHLAHLQRRLLQSSFSGRRSV